MKSLPRTKTETPPSGFILADSMSVADAKAAVAELQRRFTVPCGHCDNGIQFDGEFIEEASIIETCSACNGTGRVWRQ